MGTRSGTEPVRARRRPRMARALRGSVEELLARGDVTYTELSIGELSSCAGISRPTFYAYFTDKNGLLQTLAADVMDDLVASAGRWLDLPPTAGRADVRDAVVDIAGTYCEHRMILASCVEVASYDATMRAQFAGVVEHAAETVADHIATGQRAGWARPGLDPRLTARWLAWMAERGLRRACAAGAMPSRATTDALGDVFWFTLYEGVR